MKVLTQGELQTLIEKQAEPCVSIFIPTQRAGQAIQQNPIALKNQLREAEKQLEQRGLHPSSITPLLEPLQKLIADTPFWHEQSDGLAVFVAPDEFRYYRVPLSFKPQVYVANRFSVKPLLPLFMGDGRFYLLALSQNQVRLFQGTRYSISEIKHKTLPESLAKALWYESLEKQHKFRTGTSAPAGGGSRPGIYYSHGGSETDRKERIVQFFRQINGALQPLLGERGEPLVLAGVEYLHPIYREVNTYPHLVAGGIIGSPDDIGAHELHRQAWELLRPHFEADQQKALARYQQLADSGRTSDKIEEVVRATNYGRVEVLFVAAEAQQWGTFDPDSGEVNLHDQAGPDVIDLLDFATTETLLSGGTAYAIPSEKVPGQSLLAAIFRY